MVLTVEDCSLCVSSNVYFVWKFDRVVLMLKTVGDALEPGDVVDVHGRLTQDHNGLLTAGCPHDFRWSQTHGHTLSIAGLQQAAAAVGRAIKNRAEFQLRGLAWCEVPD